MALLADVYGIGLDERRVAFAATLNGPLAGQELLKKKRNAALGFTFSCIVRRGRWWWRWGIYSLLT